MTVLKFIKMEKWIHN